MCVWLHILVVCVYRSSGFGDIYPTTKGGRIFFLFWAFIGVPCTAFFMALIAAVILRVILWPRFHAARKYARTFVQPLQYRRSWWRSARRPLDRSSSASSDSIVTANESFLLTNSTLSISSNLAAEELPPEPSSSSLPTTTTTDSSAPSRADPQPPFDTLFGFSPPVWLDHSADSLHFIWFVVSNTGLSPRSRLGLFFGSCVLFWLFCASIFVFVAHFSYLNAWFYTISMSYALGIGFASPNSASRGVSAVLGFPAVGLVAMLVTHVQLLIEARTVRTRVLLPWLFHDSESTLQVTANMRHALSAAKKLNPEEHLEFLSRLGEREFVSMFADRIAVLSLRSQAVSVPAMPIEGPLERLAGSCTRCCPRVVTASARVLLHAARARIVVCLLLCATALLVGAAIMQHIERANPRWTFLVSVYFGTTSLSGIGLGDFSPATDGGKVFFIFWEVFCAPLFATGASALAMIAFKICNTIRIGTVRTVTRLKGPIQLGDPNNNNNTTTTSDRPIARWIRLALVKLLNFVLFADDSLAFALIVLVNLIGAAIFMAIEDLSYLDSLYFCVGYTATIGLGDIVPHTNGGYVFCIFFGIVGVGIVASLLGKFADAAAGLLLYQLVDLTLSTRQLRAYHLASKLTEEELQWLKRKLRNERPLRLTPDDG